MTLMIEQELERQIGKYICDEWALTFGQIYMYTALSKLSSEN